VTTAPMVRYRCAQHPTLKVRVSSDVSGDFKPITYAEFRDGVLDLNVGDSAYEATVEAIERAMAAGTVTDEVDDSPEEERLEREYQESLRRVVCPEVGCGRQSRNEEAADAHRQLHAELREVAAAA
jgi:hypothetical protein